MTVIFVHGWSVRNTDTYGALPERLRTAGRGVKSIFLSEYVSFHDQVTVDDIARAFDRAWREHVPPGERFACVTHSTGGPVVRTWMDLFYGAARLSECPLSHLVMLAPANHGSALAALGKSRLSRMKFFTEGVEPGERVLDWLEPGSPAQWDLNLRSLDYDYLAAGVYPFVLTGQRIDHHFYDHLNSYTGEPGSDGVVRVCAANLNYASIVLRQGPHGRLALDRHVPSPPVACGVLPGMAHSGERCGIMRSVAAEGEHETLTQVLRCLSVRNPDDYHRAAADLDALTAHTQQHERIRVVPKLCGDAATLTSRYSMLLFRLRDDRGAPVGDYDLLLTAGPDYSPDELPPGFFQDRQRNSLDPSRLAYYLDYDRMVEGLSLPTLGRKIGLRVVARPDSGLACYTVAELATGLDALDGLLRPNQTAMIDIVLRRAVDARIYRLSPSLDPEDFTDAGRRAA
jgi:hypothetical protein